MWVQREHTQGNSYTLGPIHLDIFLIHVNAQLLIHLVTGHENRQTPIITTAQSTLPACFCIVQENLKVHCVGL